MVAFWALAFAPATHAAAGDLDPSFGAAGKLLGPRGGVDSLALQGDGKILAGGWVEDGSAIARFNPDGSLDGSFGQGGVAVSSGGSVTSLLIEANGRIVALHGLRLARHLPDGSLDPTFGRRGAVNVPITGVGGADPEANDVIEQPDGKLVVAGSDFSHFVLVRYDASGTPDASFGNGGVISTNFGGGQASATEIVLQPDGKLVAGGYAVTSAFGFALVRYKSDGSLDNSFGPGGKVLTPINGFSQAEALIIQPDRKLVAAGLGQPSPGHGSTFALARYSPNGALDPSFGSGGLAFGSAYGSVTALARQPDGKLVAAGYEVGIGSGAPLSYTPYYFSIARFNGDGSPDAGFGSAGRMVTSLGSEVSDSATSLVLQPDGKPVVAGYAADGRDYGGSIPILKMALARYSGDTVTTAGAPALGPKPSVKSLRKLSRRSARAKVKSSLRHKFGRAYKRGKLKYLTCKRLSATAFRCSYFFRYGKKKRFGTVTVRRTVTGIKIKIKPLH